MNTRNAGQVAVVLTAIFLAVSAVAEVPQMINYQGYLTMPNGQPVQGDFVDITFTIYDASTGGMNLWSSGIQSVDMDVGRFNYLLGSNVPFLADLFSADISRWLGIKVDADPEMAPRTRLASVPYALHAAVADTAGYATNGSRWTLNNSVLYTNNYWGIARGGAGNAMYGANSHTMVNFGVNCTTGTDGENRTHCTVSGGEYNTASHIFSTVSGGDHNTASGGYSSVGGGENNTASAHKSTIGGGTDNTASEYWSTVSGGIGNTASGWFSTTAGGWNNIASDSATAVGGGRNNHAESKYSWIGGGYGNTTKGYAAVIPGGVNNLAVGDYSIACGRGAKALHAGTFAWADASGEELQSTQPNQFLIRASGGTKVYSNADQSAGITMHAGASAWAVNSDRNLKENFTPVDGSELLEKIAMLPITGWNYKSQSEDIKHIGPVAQDFYAVFGLGDDDVTISTIDPSGVALAAVQALLDKVEKLEQRIAELEAR